jgi:hypothetical protein
MQRQLDDSVNTEQQMLEIAAAFAAFAPAALAEIVLRHR